MSREICTVPSQHYHPVRNSHIPLNEKGECVVAIMRHRNTLYRRVILASVQLSGKGSATMSASFSVTLIEVKVILSFRADLEVLESGTGGKRNGK